MPPRMLPSRRPTRARRGTGSVYWDAERGRWTGAVSIDGQRRKVHASSRSEARDKLNAVLAGEPPAAPTRARVDVPAAVVSDEAPTVAALLDQWLARDVAGRDLAPSTVTLHRWSADLWTQTIGHLRVDALTVSIVEDGLDLIHRRHDLGRSTMTKVLGTLRQALRYSTRRGWTTVNAASDALVPATARRSVPRIALAPDDARRLLAHLRTEPLGLLWALSLRLGLRPGEAAGLDWADIDLARGVLNVRRTVQADQRGAVTVVDRLKVDSARRTLELPDDLTAWLREARAARTVVGLAGDGLVFARSDGQPLHPTTTRDELAAVCKRAAVPVVLPNELRHSCASLLIDQGAPIERVADLLGHNSTRMVDATYRHRLRPTIDVARAADWTRSVR